MSEPATITRIAEAESDPVLLAGIVQRASAPGFERFRSQLRSSGYCALPVRLRGEICDQHGQRVWATDGEPDGVLRVACGNRREAVCPSCAERYRQDAYHLIGAGMRGGKGVPDSVSAHPFVFATLTAPSFGHVHTRPLDRHGHPVRCRPRRDASVCEHGVTLSCGQVHDEDDPCLGLPLCLDCFDHEAAVMWNNTLGELWRRTTVYLPRHLAAVLGMTQKRLRQLVRIAYVKVAEFQARGLVHVHVVIRVDRAMPGYRKDEIRPPDPRFTGGLLEHAVNGAIVAVSAPIAEDLADELGEQRVRWGQERDVRPVEEPGRLAGYLAKYSTKSTEQAGGLLHPIDPESVDTAPVSEHIRDYLRAAFGLHDVAQRASEERRAAEREQYRSEHASQDRLGAITTRRDGAATLAWRARLAQGRDETIRIRLLDGTEHTDRIERIATTAPRPEAEEETLLLTLAGGQDVHLAEIEVIASPTPSEPEALAARGGPRLAANAHNLGYRGHCLTKSRRWSTTFKALRHAREQHVREQLRTACGGGPDSQRQLAELEPEERVSRFEFAGVGHLTTADAYLAAQAAAQAREHQRLAREELCDRHSRGKECRWIKSRR
jgi:hypothetical protein